MSYVQVSFEKSFDGSSTGTDTNWDGAEYSCDRDSVTGLGNVDKFIVEANRDGMRRLTIWNDVCCESLGFGGWDLEFLGDERFVCLRIHFCCELIPSCLFVDKQDEDIELARQCDRDQGRRSLSDYMHHIGRMLST